MSSPRKAIWEAIEGRCEVHREKGRPLTYISKCHECGLDSGPWPTRLTAGISSLVHLNNHHPKGATMTNIAKPDMFDDAEPGTFDAAHVESAVQDVLDTLCTGRVQSIGYADDDDLTPLDVAHLVLTELGVGGSDE